MLCRGWPEVMGCGWWVVQVVPGTGACGDPTAGPPFKSLQYNLKDRTSVLKVTTQDHG